jgi:hypothetical protein
MGSDSGNKPSLLTMRDLELRRLTIAWPFTAGALASGLICLCLHMYYYNNTRTTSDCQISLGTYRGHEYRHELQTKASRCLVESKFLKLQQHSVQFGVDDPVISDWLWIDYVRAAGDRSQTSQLFRPILSLSMTVLMYSLNPNQTNSGSFVKANTPWRIVRAGRLSVESLNPPRTTDRP